MVMKKVAVMLIFLLFLGFALAERPYDEAAKATFESLKSGDYALLEPHLDSEMKKAFTESYFKAFRDQLISKYGELKSYEFTKEGKQGEFIIAYYRFEFEKAYLTLRLVFREVNGEYKLSGLWIDAVNPTEGEKGIPTPVAMAFPMLGGILAFLTFYLMGFKKIHWAELILGFFLVLVTLFVQSPIQQVPFLIMGIKSNTDVIAKGAMFIVLTSIWLGFVAGFFQEGLKYVFSRNKSLRIALFIGLGFGVGEAIIIPLLQLVQSMTLGIPPSQTLSMTLLGGAERYLVTLFHAGTTIVLAYAYKNGFGRKAFLSLSIAHGIIDTFAAHYQLTQSQTSLILTYIVLIAVTLIILRYALPKAKEEKEEEKVVW
ncbi:DUF3887 domain-containing protein [Palaeococcus pacificus]|nr:DUF3887 domain-containing protein [Palaeococcus pacificus]